MYVTASCGSCATMSTYRTHLEYFEKEGQQWAQYQTTANPRVKLELVVEIM